jgi:hypothetical protein
MERIDPIGTVGFLAAEAELILDENWVVRESRSFAIRLIASTLAAIYEEIRRVSFCVAAKPSRVLRARYR